MKHQRITRRSCAILGIATLVSVPATAQANEDLLSTLKNFDLAQAIVPSNRPESFATTLYLEEGELDLVLERKSVWAKDAVVEVHRDGGRIDLLPAPEANTYRGHVAGQHGSAVAAAFTSGGFHAAIQIPGQGVRMIESVDPASGVFVVYRDRDVIADFAECEQPTMENQRLGEVSPQGRISSRSAGTLFVAELALDTDYEYFQRFFFSQSAVLDELGKVVNNVNFLGFGSGGGTSGTGIEHLLTKAIVRTSPNDPYSSTDGQSINQEQVAEWTTNETQTPYDLVLLFTGKDTCSPSSGCALAGRANMIGIVCDRSKAFCFTEYRGNDITQFQIAAHELGHLWDARHCDSDSNSPCFGIEPCRLMCSSINGCQNSTFPQMLVGFGPCNRDVVIAFRDTLSCLGTTTDIVYVEWDSSPFGFSGSGTSEDPYNTLWSAVNQVTSGGIIVIYGGQSSISVLEPAPMTINKNVTIRAFNGPVILNN